LENTTAHIGHTWGR